MTIENMTLSEEICGKYILTFQFISVTIILEGTKMILLTKHKCRKCPYKLGVIKFIENPCPECRNSGRKTSPFPEPVVKYKKK
ncbi:MAG: hypothetical protein IKK91_10200 [Ruminococcus sp.]|nr:hypothetical protein [Ruminococcus sp.]